MPCCVHGGATFAVRQVTNAVERSDISVHNTLQMLQCKNSPLQHIMLVEAMLTRKWGDAQNFKHYLYSPNPQLDWDYIMGRETRTFFNCCKPQLVTHCPHTYGCSASFRLYLSGGANVHAQLIHNNSAPTHSPSQMEDRLVQPFLHGRCHILCNIHYIVPLHSTLNLSFAMGGLDPI